MERLIDNARILSIAVCLAVICLGSFVRYRYAVQESAWIDELHTAWTVSGSFSETGARAKDGNQSPFYFWICYPAFNSLGQGNLALRAVSLVGGIFFLISLPTVVWLLTRSQLAAVATCLVAVMDDSFLYFAVEARPYVLVQLVAVWQAYFFVGWLQQVVNGERNARNIRIITKQTVALGLLTTLLFYLHFTSVVFLFGELIVFLALIIFRREPVKLHGLGTASIILTVCVLICLPGLIQLAGIASVKQQWSHMINPQSFADQFWKAFGIVFVALISSLIARHISKFNESSTTKNLAVIVSFLFAFPVLLSGLLSNYDIAGLAMYRYNAASFALAILAVGIAITFAPKGLPRLVCVTVVVLASWFSNSHLPAWIADGQLARLRVENWDRVSEIVAEDSSPIILFPNLVEDVSYPDEPSERLKAYYRFPLETHLYDANFDGRYIESLPIFGFEGVGDEAWNEISSDGEAWLVIRAWDEDVEMILRAMDDQASSKGQLFDREYIDTNSSVRLVRLKVLPIPGFDLSD